MALQLPPADRYPRTMKRLVLAVWLIGALLCHAEAEEVEFTSTLSPADFSAAGLAGLSRDQLARLNTLVENYKSSTVAAARRAAAEALAAKQVAEIEAARSEKKAEAARTAAAKAETSQPTSQEGFLARAKGLLKSGDKPPVAAVESSISGKFQGWEPRQIFVLANGQRWQVAGSDSYYSPVIENPKVQIVPGAIAGYWLRFPGLGAEVRVNFLGDDKPVPNGH
jgi:hypothetical protein